VLLGPAAIRFARKGCAVLAGTAHSDYVAYLDSYTPVVADVARRAAQSRMRRFFDRMGVVFAPSEGIERALRSWGVSAPIKRTTYPIDVSAFEPRTQSQARSELGIAENRPLALYAGRLAVDKRVLALLREFEVTLARVPEAMLAIVGGGPMSEQVQREAARLGGKVVLTGPLDASRLGAWYCAADAFVSASPNEVGPLATLEAGLLGTPTVAHAAPGFVDRIADGVNGRLAGDGTGDLGRALGDVLANRDAARRMGEAAQAAFAEHTPARSADVLLAAYRGAADACSSRRRAARDRPRLKADAE
jgi:glycosyltransferase involved in cell wall biosynthesis